MAKKSYSIQQEETLHPMPGLRQVGRTFMAFTADDGGFWNLNKHVYPISEERLLQLMETAHKNLWAVFEIDVLMEDPRNVSGGETDS